MRAANLPRPTPDLREQKALVQRSDAREPKAFGDCNRSFTSRTRNGAYHGTRTD